MMTETTVDIEMECGCCELSTNEAFADLAYANLIEADGPKYTKEELQFAKELQKTVEQGIIEKEKNLHQVYDEANDLGCSTKISGKKQNLEHPPILRCQQNHANLFVYNSMLADRMLSTYMAGNRKWRNFHWR